MKPLISIVVPVYNVEEYINECIESIQKQTYTNLEILVINDGTKDRSIEVIKDLMNDPRIQVINQSNQGLSGARNTGMRAAKGKYISLIDSDDKVKPTFIEELYQKAIETDADIVRGSFRDFDGKVPDGWVTDFNICPSKGTEALKQVEQEPDIIRLDINMPGLDGLKVCERIRDYVSCPILFLTARIEDTDKVKGFAVGGDDYIVKPFQIGELMARVEALLRRYGKINNKLTFADVEVDMVSRTVSKGGKPVELTVKEFDLLVELIQNKNAALYREKLYEKVWGEPYVGDTRTLDSHIQRLRRKLDWDNYIKTVFRIGYRLEDGE